MKYYLKCQYGKGFFKGESAVSIRNSYNESSFLTWNDELVRPNNRNSGEGFVKIHGIESKDAEKAVVFVRQEGVLRRVRIPLEDIVEKK
ncbi:MAG: hypothetical protein PHO02_05260 [Candidatus Nanoarchaeia archaeon]|nr:hypothetical protein [Candidatus Nanoarchaeia archaeon]